MARNSAASVFLGMLAFMSSGCGTICNLAGAIVPYGDAVRRPAIYGGVQTDLAFYDRQLNMVGGNRVPATAKEGEGAVFMVALAYADFPLSLIGDTLTLPIALWVNSRPEAAKDSVTTAKDRPLRPVGPSTAFPISDKPDGK